MILYFPEVWTRGRGFCGGVPGQVALCAGDSRKIAAAYFLKWFPPKHWHQVEGLSSQGGTQGGGRWGESYSVCVCAGEREG